MNIIKKITDIAKSPELTVGHDNFDRNDNPKPQSVRRPGKTPGDGWKLIEDLIRDHDKYVGKKR
jgi:hypothetical protein